ncbi:hypothetical protein [Pararhodobacter oceanensis]|uniref:hypothetical protein n=1 Tax=Pararhodobacter oceanensis TaxID=2172121 RepID=UPI003A8CCAA1
MFKLTLSAAALALATFSAQATPVTEITLAESPALLTVQRAAAVPQTEALDQVAYYCEWATVYDYYGNWVTVWQCY